MTRRSTCTVAALLASIPITGCEVTGTVSPGDQPIVRRPDGGVIPDGLIDLRLEPSVVELRIVDAEPDRQELRVVGLFDDDAEVELPFSEFPIQLRVRDTRLAFIDDQGAVVSFTNFGGVSEIEASLGGFETTAELRVAYEREVILPPPPGSQGGVPLPDDPAAVFEAAETNGADPVRAPEIVYPYDDVVLPPNLAGVVVQFREGVPDNSVFELGFRNDATDVRFFTGCTRPNGIGRDGQCIIELDQTSYEFLSRTNGGGRPLTLRVRATDADGTSLGVSDPVTLRFTEDDINGTLYYWSTSDRAIIRFDFGDPTAEPETVVEPADADDRCVGCHAISRDGTKVLASVGGQNEGGVMLRNLEVDRGEDGDFIWDAPQEEILQFAAFSPSGDEFVGVFGDSDRYEEPDGADNFGDLILFRTDCDDVPDGCQIGRIDLGGREASHPDWASTGDLIAFTDVGINNTSQRPYDGAISFVRRPSAQAPWARPEVRIPRVDGRSRYNPSFSPDAAIFAFNESTCPGGDPQDRDCNADSDPSAKVWAATTEGDAAPVLLANAMQAGPTDPNDDLANTFPRFAPFEFLLERGELGERRVLWLTFASIRRYGFRTPPGDSNEEAVRGTWLWMVAVEPGKVARGEDPSFAPFLLPFQDLSTSNHIGVWTTESVGQPVLR